jgi:hypothetical protein
MRSFLRLARTGFLATASVALVGITLMLAVPGSAAAAAFTARLKAPNHQPIANKKWRITVTATRGRAKLSGSVSYEFLFDGVVEAHRPGHKFKHGVYHDALLFPDEAIGHTLSLHVIVKTRYGTVSLPWWIKTRR